MASALFDRGRAERFAELLEQAGSGRRLRRHRHSGGYLRLAPLVRTTQQLTAAEVPVPIDPEFRAQLRARLVAAAARQAAGEELVDLSFVSSRRLAQPKLPARQARTIGQRRARAAVLVGVTAGALALSGVSAASSTAKPGDPLYQFKRSTEKAQLALASSDLSRGQLYFEFAQTRIQEAAEVGPDLLDGVLADMDNETRLGARLLLSAATDQRSSTALAVVDDFLHGQYTRLRQLERDRGPAGAARVAQSRQVLDELSRTASQVRATIN